MNGIRRSRLLIPGTVVLAHLLWFATFYLTFGSFWIKIALSASIMAAASLWAQRTMADRFRMDMKALFTGVAAAIALYLIFWAGKEISSMLFPFAEDQIKDIYQRDAGGIPLWSIFLILLFITGPSEEIFWRGFLQENLTLRFGSLKGFLLMTVCYASVHLWSFNFILIGAAVVAGAFWGMLYGHTKNLAPLIISHSLWSAFIFAVAPLG